MEQETNGKALLLRASQDILPCDQCNNVYTKWADLQMHLEAHRDERPYQCQQCGKSYRHAGSLVNHKRTHETGLYQCVTCEKEFTNPMALKGHERLHMAKKRFRCNECGKAFRVSTQLMHHRKIHAEKPYYCGLCDELFLSSSSYEQHQALHGGQEPLPDRTDLPLSPGAHPGAARRHGTATSAAAMQRDAPGGLAAHALPSVATIDPTKSDLKNLPKSSSESDAHPDDADPRADPTEDPQEERPYRCNECGKSYKHAGSLTNHRQTHTLGYYQCTICLKEYSNIMALKYHVRLHSEYKPYKCAVCAKAFRGTTELMNHRRIHTGEKPYCCDHCGDRFFTKYQLQQHKLTHGGGSSLDSNLIDISGSSENSEHAPPHASREDSGEKSFQAEGHRGKLSHEDRGSFELAGSSEDLQGQSASDREREALHYGTHQASSDNELAKVQNEDLLYGVDSYPCGEIQSLEEEKPHLCVYCGGVQNDHEAPHDHSCVCDTESSGYSAVQSSLEAELAASDFKSYQLPRTGNAASNVNLLEDPQIAEASEDRPYKCSQCGKTYRHAGSLINHKQTHQTGVYPCSVCMKQCFNLAALKNHVRIHSKSKLSRGQQNGFLFVGESMELQSSKSWETAYFCSFCDQAFSHEADLQKHEVLHQNNQPAADQLDISNPGSYADFFQNTVASGTEAVSYDADLDPSGNTFFKAIKPDVKDAKDNVVCDDDETTAEQPAMCGSCGEICNNVEALKTHNCIADGEAAGSKDCTNQTGKDSDCQNVHLNDNQILDTSVAMDSSDLAGSQAKYTQSHIEDEERPYKCNLCDKTYKHAGSLINHKHTHQTGVYQCSICPRQYPNLAALKTHLRIHTKFKSLRSSSDSNISHFYISGEPTDLQCVESMETPHCCSVCGENFFTRSDLQQHQAVYGHSKVTEGDTLKKISPASSPTTESVKLLMGDIQPSESSMSMLVSEHGSLNVIKCETDQTSEVGFHEEVFQEEADQPYICGHCGEIYEDIESLNNHRGSHNVEGMCVERTEQLNVSTGQQNIKLNFHQMVDAENNCMDSESGVKMDCPTDSPNSDENAEERPYSCDQCGKTYRHAGSLLNHKQTHQMGAYSCPVCPKQFHNLRAFKNHLRKHPKCKLSKSYYSLMKINDSNLSANAQSKDTTSYASDSESSSSETNMQKCQALKSEVTTEEDSSVVQVLSENSCEDAGNNFNSLKIKISRTIDGERVDIKKPVGCRSTETGSYLPGTDAQAKAHNHPLEPGDNSVRASVKSENDYTHEESCNEFEKHAEEKAYICGYCGDTYKDGGSLEKHKCNHLGKLADAVDFSINLEPRVMSQGSSNISERNRAQYNADADDRPFKCDQCGRTYRHAGSLLNHKHTHKTGVFRCFVCQKRFFNVMALKNHHRIHFDKKQFKCFVCAKAFRLRSQLMSHQKVHTERTLSFKKLGRRSKKTIRNSRNLVKSVRSHEMNLFHNDKPLNPDQGEDEGDIDHVGVEKETFICPDCGELYSNVENHNCKGKMVCIVNSPTHTNTEGDSGKTATGGEAGSNNFEQAHSIQTERQVEDAQVNEDRPYKCEQCGKTYRHAGSLLNHKKTHKTGEFFCSICEKTYPNLLAMKNHQRIHFEMKRFSCSECGKAFRGRKQLLKHRCSRMWKSPYPSKKTFSNKLALGEHGQEHKPEETQSSAEVLEQSPVRKNGDTVKNSTTVHVAVSKYGLDNTEGLDTFNNKMTSIEADHHHTDTEEHHCAKKHRKTFQNSEGLAIRRPLSIRKKLMPRVGSSASSIPSEPDIAYQKKPDARKEVLKLDVSEIPESQTEIRPFKCDQCGKTYRHPGSLLNHKYTHETGLYKCAICLKEFFNPIALKNHQRIHLNEKKHKCLVCGKAFWRSREFINHQRIHTGEKPFRCSVCTKCFRSKFRLQQHQKIHSRLKTVQKYAISKQFRGTGSEPAAKSAERALQLTEHNAGFGYPLNGLDYASTNSKGNCLKKNHNRDTSGQKEDSIGSPGNDLRPFECDQCGKTYRHAGSLLNHKNTHKTGIYQCSTCLKEFSNPMALKNHQRIHLDKKKYQCTDCGKAFRVSTHLISHRLVHTKERPYFCMVCSKGFSSKSNLHQHQLTHKKRPVQSGGSRLRGRTKAVLHGNARR
ncbi:zinc finger protein 646 [Latimeria chalumnae]|uniref:zinc finger protein 646 n=1 Tax=Latimeria chalumnae TaxID=7897 RepID=UPI0003C19351|nr:PREDICTED: zinc finger protein 646 [Latimeria chalumnae]|eukprot:XP_006007844.1 PREDICTED: zinc finger protein 646 [Latimeria chalumnae]